MLWPVLVHSIEFGLVPFMQILSDLLLFWCFE